MSRLALHLSLASIALLHLCASCSRDANESDLPEPHSVHLFDVEGSDARLPEGLWTEETVWVHELTRNGNWEAGDDSGWSIATRFPMSAPGRIVDATAALKPHSGRDLVTGESADPAPGQVVIVNSRVRAAGPDRPVDFSLAYRSLVKHVVAKITGNDSGHIGPPADLELRFKNRRSVKVPSGSELTYPVELDGGRARLQFGFAALGEQLFGGPEGLRLLPVEGLVGRLTIEAETAAKERIRLWQRDVQAFESGYYWHQSVDLGSLGAGSFKLHFKASPEPKDAGNTAFWAWSEPVVEPVRRSAKPNVVVLLLDTVRADRLGCYGWERAQTPNLDRLARRGVRFAEAMSAASWTLPAHASLFTSSYPSQHAVWTDSVRLAPEFLTVAELLRSRGYRTAAFTDGGFVRAEFGLAQGFDQFRIFEDSDVDTSFSAARNWIERTTGPFFLFLQTYKAHSPYDPPEKFRKRLVRPYAGRLPERVNVPEYAWGGPTEERPTDEDVRYLQDLYDAEIATIDDGIGKLIGFLEKSGRMDNTLVVVTSDHGEEFFDHGQAGHGWSLYQEQLHIPLIVYWKGEDDFEGGRVVNHPVMAIDIAPTLALAAGARKPDSWEGHALTLDPPATERPLFFPMMTHFFSRGKKAVALVEGELKYLYYPTGHRPGDPTGTHALFDLSADPGEQHNLAAGLAAEWFRKAEDLWKRYGPRAASLDSQLDPAIRADLRRLGYTDGPLKKE